MNWCEHHGLPMYQVHASGHVMPHQLKEAIEKIDPARVFPVHTERPELFKRYMQDIDPEIVLPQLNKSMEV